jgi:hypothetical protein
VGVGVEQIASQWQALRDLAAERGRRQPIQTVLRVNPAYSAQAHDGAGRRPFQGNADQIVTDLAAFAEIGMDAVLLDLQTTPRDAQELKDVAAEVYEKAAGL